MSSIGQEELDQDIEIGKAPDFNAWVKALEADPEYLEVDYG